jgi:hypothetical protein
MLRAILTLAAALALAPSAQAAILHVDTDADVPVGNAADCTDASAATPCSIRDALAAAATTMEDDRVDVPTGHYVLGGTSLHVQGPGAVTIAGTDAATTTLDGANASRVLELDVNTTIEGVTIRDGRVPSQGGGILANEGNIVVRDSVVESNDAGTGPGETGQGGGIVVLNTGATLLERTIVRDNRAGSQGGGIWVGPGADPLTAVDSTITSNHAQPASGGSASGGGVYADGRLALTRVTLSQNGATAPAIADDAGVGGGAVALDGLTVTDSTVAGNTATGLNGGVGAGGGLYVSGTQPAAISGTTFTANAASGTGSVVAGGAIRHFGAALAITNSTFSGNSATATAGATAARGGGLVSDAAVTLTNVTMVGNTAAGNGPGGGNLVAGLAALRNTLIAGGAPANCSFTVASSVRSLDTGTTCGLGAGNLSAVANPRLGPLATNGGRSQTHALLTGSPAIDAGTRTGAPTTDQRGVRRPQRGGIDIGAFELAGPPPTGGPHADRIAPVFTADLTLTRRAFRARRATTVRYSLSEAATVTFRVQRRAAGRRVRGRCVAKTKRNRGRRTCVRYVRVKGSVKQSATAGPNELRFRRRSLRPARYRLIATAIDTAGNRSAPARVAFRILP